MDVAETDWLKEIEKLKNCDESLVYVDLAPIQKNPQLVSNLLENAVHSETQYIGQLHLQHPNECTSSLKDALDLLAVQGWILSNSTYLQDNLNFDLATIKELNLTLLKMRVRPYSIVLRNGFTKEHLAKATEIMDGLRGWTSGLAVPHLLKQSGNTFQHHLPDYVINQANEDYIFRNYKNIAYPYHNQPIKNNP